MVLMTKREYIIEQLENAKGEKADLSQRAMKFDDVPRESFQYLRERIRYLESELATLDNRSE